MTTLLFNHYKKPSFDSLLDDMFPNPRSKADIIDHNDKIEIVAEIPGFSKEEVSLNLKDNVLSIKAEKDKPENSKDIKYISQELIHSSFDRSFKLSDDFELSKIKATFTNGLLHVDILKKKPEKPKKIKIL